MLYWLGTSELFVVTFFVLGGLSSQRGPQLITISLWALFGICGVVSLVLYVAGAVSVTYCTSTQCGIVLWHWSQFVFITLPIIVLLFISCGIPSLYCYFGSQDFLKNK